MKTISVAKVLGIGAAACLFAGSALAATIPPKPPKLRAGPRAQFFEVRFDLPRGGPWVPPGEGKLVPAPLPDNGGNQILGGHASEGPSLALRGSGPGGAWGGTAVAEATPQQRVEQALQKVARELR